MAALDDFTSSNAIRMLFRDAITTGASAAVATNSKQDAISAVVVGATNSGANSTMTNSHASSWKSANESFPTLMTVFIALIVLGNLFAIAACIRFSRQWVLTQGSISNSTLHAVETGGRRPSPVGFELTKSQRRKALEELFGPKVCLVFTDSCAMLSVG
ncbi:MAG: hypothetical protein ACREBR_03015 [bacterium]